MTNNRKYVSKATYSKWENDLFTHIYKTKAQKTTKKLVPSNGKPSYLIRDKVILVMNIDVDNVTDLPKSKILLYHSGNKKRDYVSIGYDKENGAFNFACMDFGGLTNYKLDIHEYVDNKAKGFLLKKSIPLMSKDTNSKHLMATWKKLMRKSKLYGYVNNNIHKWLNSVWSYASSTCPYRISFNFVRLPKVNRIMVTKRDVFEKIGVVYLRNFGGDDSTYAYVDTDMSPTEFISLEEVSKYTKKRFVTPNINLNNIRNEYILQ